jgi:hypothetical protein
MTELIISNRSRQKLQISLKQHSKFTQKHSNPCGAHFGAFWRIFRALFVHCSCIFVDFTEKTPHIFNRLVWKKSLLVFAAISTENGRKTGVFR